MNIRLKDFIEENFENPGKALDLGAGNFTDVKALQEMGWYCEGVDKTTGTDLENSYVSQDGPFDLVFSNYVIHKLKNKVQLLITAYDNLKGEGLFFLQTFDSSDLVSSSGINKEWLKHEIESVGFREVKTLVFDYFDDDEGHKHFHRVLQIVAKK